MQAPGLLQRAARPNSNVHRSRAEGRAGGPHGRRACPLSARAPGGHSECAGTRVRGTPGDRASVPVGSGPGRRGNLET